MKFSWGNWHFYISVLAMWVCGGACAVLIDRFNIVDPARWMSFAGASLGAFFGVSIALRRFFPIKPSQALN